MENQNERDEIEIDLVVLFYVLWGHVWLILSIVQRQVWQFHDE